MVPPGKVPVRVAPSATKKHKLTFKYNTVIGNLVRQKYRLPQDTYSRN